MGFEPQYRKVILLFSQSPRIESGAHPDGYLARGEKWPGSDIDHAPPYSDEVKNE
jgi:hypothetical protein